MELGHSRSLEIAPFDRSHTRNYGPILHHFGDKWDKGRVSRFVYHDSSYQLFDAPHIYCLFPKTLHFTDRSVRWRVQFSASFQKKFASRFCL